MDDLLDLDWKATTTTKSSTAPVKQTLGNGTASGSTTTTATTGSYNFDALTRSLNSASPSNHAALRGISGTSSPANSTSIRSGTSPMLQSTNMSRNPSAQPLAASQSSSSGGADAFSSLLSFGSSASQSNGPMSLAEKQRRAQEDARKRALDEKREQEARWGAGAGWDSIDSTKGLTAKSSQAAVRQPHKPVTAPIAAKTAQSDDLWDFDSLKSTSTAPPPSKSTSAKSSSRTDDDFDWNSLEDLGTAKSAPAEEVDDTDELLGALGLPAQSMRPPAKASASRDYASANRAPSSRGTTTTRAVSPPPHILGRIVEMGFSVQQARQALAKTESGLDVEAALEALLSSQSNGNGSRPRDLDGWGPGGEPSARSRMEDEDREFARRLQDEEEEQQASIFGQSRPSDQRVERARNGSARPSSAQGSRDPRPGSAQGGGRTGTPRNDSQEALPDWQKQADQIYTQATEIGTQVFSKANAFWASAKAQAAKALEERTGGSENGSGRSSPATGSDRARSRRWGVGGAQNKDWSGKPKWLQDAEAATAAEEAAAASGGEPVDGAGGAFKDSDEEDTGSSAQAQTQQRKAAPTAARQQAAQKSASDLWDLPPAKSDPQPSTSRPTPRTAPARQRPAGRASAPLKEREIPHDEPNSVAKASQHKLAGNEAFKKGSYGDAELAYSQGLLALSSASLRRIPLLNNRATTRLKNGDSAAAVSDCTEVLALIVPGAGGTGAPVYRPQTEAPLPQPLATELNLRESWSKALLRRAQSYEADERWKDAARDWTVLEAFEKEEGSGKAGVLNMRSAQEGLARCGKMLSGAQGASSEGSSADPAVAAAAPARKPVSAAASRKVAAAVASAGEAAAQAGRARVRAEAAAQSAEDAAKFALKDTVDERVDAWKKGKENNVRALVASIELVVWPELGWKKVGMHELVTDGQVKKNYMKAVGKLHPDKISTTNTTLENRMIAASVFAVLNEAWLNSKS